jgi:CRISPR-associated endonuclease/helicase Cas3
MRKIVMILYAHTKNDPVTRDVLPEEHWQELNDHLKSVADRCGVFGSEFGAEGMGYAAGMLHDIGKATYLKIPEIPGNPVESK